MSQGWSEYNKKKRGYNATGVAENPQALEGRLKMYSAGGLRTLGYASSIMGRAKGSRECLKENVLNNGS